MFFIFAKITNDTNCNKVLTINKGEAFAQGIILHYSLTDDDNSESVREGGFGSTDGK